MQPKFATTLKKAGYFLENLSYLIELSSVVFERKTLVNLIRNFDQICKL